MTSQVETAVDETDVDEKERPASEPPSTRTGRERARWALVLVAALVAASGAFMWWHADRDPQRAEAQTRDTVLIEAQQAIENMYTLDYRSVDAGVRAWSQVTTGTLKDQLAGVSDEDRKLLADQKKISTGRVADVAVIDADADTATVIAAVEVTVKDAAAPDSEPTVKRNRFTADLVKIGGRWKLESLQQVAVSLS